MLRKILVVLVSAFGLALMVAAPALATTPGGIYSVSSAPGYTSGDVYAISNPSHYSYRADATCNAPGSPVRYGPWVSGTYADSVASCSGLGGVFYLGFEFDKTHLYYSQCWDRGTRDPLSGSCGVS